MPDLRCPRCEANFSYAEVGEDGYVRCRECRARIRIVRKGGIQAERAELWDGIVNHEAVAKTTELSSEQNPTLANPLLKSSCEPDSAVVTPSTSTTAATTRICLGNSSFYKLSVFILSLIVVALSSLLYRQYATVEHLTLELNAARDAIEDQSKIHSDTMTASRGELSQLEMTLSQAREELATTQDKLHNERSASAELLNMQRLIDKRDKSAVAVNGFIKACAIIYDGHAKLLDDIADEDFDTAKVLIADRKKVNDTIEKTYMAERERFFSGEIVKLTEQLSTARNLAVSQIGEKADEAAKQIDVEYEKTLGKIKGEPPSFSVALERVRKIHMIGVESRSNDSARKLTEYELTLRESSERSAFRRAISGLRTIHSEYVKDTLTRERAYEIYAEVGRRYRAELVLLARIGADWVPDFASSPSDITIGEAYGKFIDLLAE